MAKTKTSPSKIAVWIIIGLLIVGLAGFGTGNFGGTVRTVGAVGETEITTDEYYQALQGELGRLSQDAGRNVTLAEARALGIEQNVMARLLATAALDEEARRVGLSAGDQTVAEELRRIPAFQSASGFDREAYAFALRNAGLSEREFEEQLREDAARGLLQGAVAGGIPEPQTYTDLLSGFIGERRDVTYALVGEDVLAQPVAEPSEADLAAWYAENGGRFERPETRVITYAWLSPEALLDEVDVGEGAVERLYEERSSTYRAPERRIVERLVFPDMAEAEAAAVAIAAGEATFAGLVEQRGLEVSDIDLGDVTEAELGEAGAAVFALDGTGVAGPAPTPLGPALFRVNAVLASRDTPLGEVRDDLRRELAAGAARRAVSDLAGALDDALAGGATLEELANEPGIEIGTIEFTSGSDSGLAAYPAFREAASAVTEEDFPALENLDDGGVFALRLDEIVAPRIPDLAEVREEAAEAYAVEQTRAALAEGAERLAAAIGNAGGFDAFDLEPVAETGIARDSTLPGAPSGLAALAFEMEPGEMRVLDEAEVAVVRLDAVTPVDPEAIDAQAVRGIIGAQAAQQIAQDAADAFARAIQSGIGIEVNAQALAAVQAQIP